MKTKTTIAIANRKGGVGKTTTTIHLAYALTSLGKRVLMVDCDAQASLTAYAAEDPEQLEKEERTLLFALTGQAPLADLVIERPNAPDLIPSSESLSSAETGLLQQGKPILRKALAPLREAYDYILIDTPPTVSPMTVTAWTAADTLLIPARFDFTSARGIPQLFKTHLHLRNSLNPRLWILGILPTVYPGFKHNRETLLEIQEIAKKYGIHIFDPIPRLTAFEASAKTGRPLTAHAKRSKGALAYIALAKIINKLP